MGSTRAAEHVVHFGVFEVDLRSGELRKAGSRVALQEQPFRILARLVQRPGELVTREELRQELWPADTFVDFEHGLNAAIKRLRDALGDSAETPRFIETLPRRGYRFIAPVSNGTGLPAPAVAGWRAVRLRGRRKAWLLASGVVVMLTGITAARWIAAPQGPTPWVSKRFNLSLPGHIDLPRYGDVTISRSGDRVFFGGSKASTRAGSTSAPSIARTRRL